MRIKGKITSWKDEKGFGFITPNDGGKQIFVHIKAFNTRKKIPAINQTVTYTISTDKKGRPCAERVSRAGELLSKNIKKRTNVSVFFIPILFIVFVGVFAFTNKQVEFIFLPLYYLVVSLITFILYAVDKSAAKKGSWRIQENTLHLFSLTGGWLGAMIAQQTFRHKSKKQPFRAVFWATVVLNIGGFVYLVAYPEGEVALISIINRFTDSDLTG